MAEQASRIVPMLREIRADGAGLQEQLVAVLDRRFSSAKSARETYRAVISADKPIRTLVTRDFETRIGALERKVRELESRL
jgi:hypothetical protein